MKKKGLYDDIVGLPHYVSPTRSHMSLIDRAAQFSPFAALTGYDAAIQETGRLTVCKIEVDDTVKAQLDLKLRLLAERIVERPEVTITYFQPDDRKEGGAYITYSGRIKKIDPLEASVTMLDGVVIPIESIIEVESEDALQSLW